MKIALYGRDERGKDELSFALRRALPYGDFDIKKKTFSDGVAEGFDAYLYYFPSLSVYDSGCFAERQELRAIREACRKIPKELIVFDDEVPDCIGFLSEMIEQRGHIPFDSERILDNILADHEEIFSRHKNILLVDCDRTITDNDTTYNFCEQLNIEGEFIKKKLQPDKYTLYQFYCVAKKYTERSAAAFKSASAFALECAVINSRLIADIRNNMSGFLTVGITCGVRYTWDKMRQRLGFPDILIGGSHLKNDSYIISAYTKGRLAERLLAMGKHVVAVGDSPLDVEMLEVADKGFLVAQEKLNLGIEEYLLQKESTRIRQLCYSKHLYDGIPVANSIAD